jgi:hypothetical protein
MIMIRPTAIGSAKQWSGMLSAVFFFWYGIKFEVIHNLAEN